MVKLYIKLYNYNIVLKMGVEIMIQLLKKSYETAFLYSKNNMVIEVDDNFINITGYASNELIGKSLNEISDMLRITSQIDFENLEKEYTGFMFTKEYEPREITISCKNLNNNNEKTYIIEQNQNMSVYENFNFSKQLYTSSKTGFALLHAPDLILLKANQNYLDFLDEPYNKIHNSIGKNLKEIVTGFEGSKLEQAWNSFIAVGKTEHIEESKYDYLKRGITYWNLSLVPIFVEGKLKYIIVTMLDVTNKILNRKLLQERVKIIEEQKEQLETIIEKMSDKLLVFDKDENFIRINQSTRNHVFNSEEFKKVDDFYKNAQAFDMDGNLILKENSSFSKILKGENVSKYQIAIKTNNEVIYIELNGNPIYDSKGNLTMGIVLVKDITDKLKSEETLLLKAQHDLLNSIIENLDIGFIRYSYDDLKIKDINNKAYNELKQMQPDIGDLSSVIGLNYFDIFKDSKSNERVNYVRNLMKEKHSFNYINRKVTIEGEEKFYKIIFNPLFGLNNQICELITISIDVTDEVKAKNEMEETLKVQDEIFSNISHELKTPLNVIFSTNQLM